MDAPSIDAQTNLSARIASNPLRLLQRYKNKSKTSLHEGDPEAPAPNPRFHELALMCGVYRIVRPETIKNRRAPV